jgi:hypothetical protein
MRLRCSSGRYKSFTFLNRISRSANHGQFSCFLQALHSETQI